MLKQKIIALFALLLLIVNGVGFWQPIHAQGGELLQNPSFEALYTAGNGAVVPVGWTLVSSVPVSSSGHTWPGESRTGASWKINNNKQVFTMVGYQFVPGVRSGTKLRFSAWGNVYTCDREDSCIDGSKGYRISMQASQARTRVGVDPKGGTDFNAATVQWTPYISPFDHFEQMTIDFTSQNDNGVTVFLFTTQTTGMFLNHAYWDDASLQVLQAGAGAPSSGGGGVAAVAPTQAQQYAPAVRTQPPQADGSIVHTVQAGDTLSSIAVAYKVTVQQIRELNNLAPDFKFLQIGQKLTIKPPDQPGAEGTVAATAAADGSGAPSFGPMVTPTYTPEIPVRNTIPANPTSAATLQVDGATAEPTQVAALPTIAPPTLIPINKEGSLCVTAFDDGNTNHRQDADEKLLAGVQLKLAQDTKSAKNTTTTAEKPTCFNGLTAGNYTIAAVAPENYGLTTAGQLEIEIKPGVPLTLSFGAAKDYQPTPASSDTVIKELPPPSIAAQQTKPTGILDSVFNNSGLIVMGIAGLVLVTGLGMILVVRRR